MSAEPLRLGLVGCGRLAEAGYLPAISRCTGIRLVAVVDPDPARRARIVGSTEPGCTVGSFGDLATMLERSLPDAVVLASPAAAHVPGATLATQAGVGVLVEKPPAPDVAGAARLAALRPPPWIGFNRRFDDGAQAVRAAVHGGTGLALTLGISYRRRSWAAHTVHDDVLDDLGPHLVDWARWVSGSDATSVTSATVDADRARFELELGCGRATILAAADRVHAERLEVRDASGAVLARHRLGGFVGAVAGRLRSGPHPLVASLAAQLDAFRHAVRGDSDHAAALGTAADGAAAMAVLDAVRTSARCGGRTVAVDRPVEA